jgi:hypothetical protein
MVNYTNIIPPFLNNTNNTVTPAQFAQSYFQSFPSLIQQGDLSATILALILFFIALVIINKLSSILLAIIKRTIVFIITSLILYKYIPVFIDKIMLEGFTIQNLLIGFSGSLICIAAFTIATINLFKHTKKAIGEQKLQQVKEKDVEKIVAEEAPFTFGSLTKDKSLLSLLTYLTVAEFGVFSSVTMAAPNVKVGISFFIIFLIASIVFIKQSYKNYKKGLAHLVIALIVGFALSLLLGTLWGNQPISNLISLNYFSSDSLVALISGMAVSLFAGSKQ